MPRKPLAIALLLALCATLAAITWWLLSGPAAGPAPVDPQRLLRAHAPSQGPANAPVVIVEFFDPACGTCRQFYPLVHQLMAQHPGRIRLVMRYAPFHTGSDKVVAVLHAAHLQGRFWPALEALFEGQDDWASNHTAKVDRTWPYLGRVGLNQEQLAFDLSAPALQQALAQDMADANALGVAQTPEYFVNGKPMPTFGWEPLQQLVAQELARTQ